MIDFGDLEFSRIALAVLLNFVWQAALIAIVMYFLKSFVGVAYVRLQYGISVVGLFSLIALPMASFFIFVFAYGSLPVVPERVNSLLAMPSVVAASPSIRLSFLESMFLWFDSARVWWLGIWLLGAALFTARTSLGLLTSFSIRKDTAPLPENVQVIVRRICGNLRIGANISVKVSSKVTQAVATGIFKPMVLLPVAWVTEMPTAALEAIIAHELAHIKRLDLWLVSIQRCVETVFFFHPATWWISRTLTQEREACCDRLAVEATGNRLKYAETLALIASARHSNYPSTSFCSAFNGGQKMNLLRRISLVLEPSRSMRRAPLRPFASIACLSMMIAMGSYSYSVSASPSSGSLSERQDDDNKSAKKVKRIKIVEKEHGDENAEGHTVYRWVAEADKSDENKGFIVDLIVEDGNQDDNKSKNVWHAKRKKAVLEQIEGQGEYGVILDALVAQDVQGVVELIHASQGGEDGENESKPHGLHLFDSENNRAIEVTGKFKLHDGHGVWIAGEDGEDGDKKRGVWMIHGQDDDTEKGAWMILGDTKVQVPKGRSLHLKSDKGSWIKKGKKSTLHRSADHGQHAIVDFESNKHIVVLSKIRPHESGEAHGIYHLHEATGDTPDGVHKKAFGAVLGLPHVNISGDILTLDVKLDLKQDKKANRYFLHKIDSKKSHIDSGHKKIRIQHKKKMSDESSVKGNHRIITKWTPESGGGNGSDQTIRSNIRKLDIPLEKRGNRSYLLKRKSKVDDGEYKSEIKKHLAKTGAGSKVHGSLTKVRFKPKHKPHSQTRTNEEALAEILAELKELRRELNELKGDR